MLDGSWLSWALGPDHPFGRELPGAGGAAVGGRWGVSEALAQAWAGSEEPTGKRRSPGPPLRPEGPREGCPWTTVGLQPAGPPDSVWPAPRVWAGGKKDAGLPSPRPQPLRSLPWAAPNRRSASSLGEHAGQPAGRGTGGQRGVWGGGQTTAFPGTQGHRVALGPRDTPEEGAELSLPFTAAQTTP